MKCAVCNEVEETEDRKLNEGTEIGVCTFCGAILKPLKSKQQDRLQEICEAIDFVEAVKSLTLRRR